MESSETTASVFDALTKAVAELENPKASRWVNTGKFSYAFSPLDEIVTTVRGVLAEHGLALLQEAVSNGGNVGVTTRIVHTSGEWIEMGPLLLPAGQGPQDYGSALTYARRYALTSALLLAAEEDDDAGSAQKATKPTMGEVFKKPKPQGVEGVSRGSSEIATDEHSPRDPGTRSERSLDQDQPPAASSTASKYPFVPKDCPHLRWNESPTNSKFVVCPGCGEARLRAEVGV